MVMVDIIETTKGNDVGLLRTIIELHYSWAVTDINFEERGGLRLNREFNIASREKFRHKKLLGDHKSSSAITRTSCRWLNRNV